MPPRRDTVPPSQPGKVSAIEGNLNILPPPPSRTVPSTREPSSRTGSNEASRGQVTAGDDSESDELEDEGPEGPARSYEMPDSTFANRRPPQISPDRCIPLKHAIHSIAINGRYAVTGSTHLRIWDTFTGESKAVIVLGSGDTKVTALQHIHPAGRADLGGDLLWAGTKDGYLYEIDLTRMECSHSRMSAHSHSITGIYLTPNNTVTTVCEAGKVQQWSNDADPTAMPLLSSQPKTQRLADKHTFVQAIGSQLWSSTGPHRHHITSTSAAAARSPAIRVYNVGLNDTAFNINMKPAYLFEAAGQVGAVMAAATLGNQADVVYLSHETGHISVWDRNNVTCTSVFRVSNYAITAMQGVLSHLWTGNREGLIHVYDTSQTPWKVVKAWKGLNEPIVGILVDLGSVAKVSFLF